jgi:hypothetical protein
MVCLTGYGSFDVEKWEEGTERRKGIHSKGMKPKTYKRNLVISLKKR